MHAEVSVLIPAWQAEAFIDRTMVCARTQTFDSQRIIVSVDQSDDATAERCRRHAADDDRVEVHVQSERLGWTGNVNFLLDRVETEFAFIYFHDDLIEPTYSERLVGALRAHPDAINAYCDMEAFGGGGYFQPARAYVGTAAERLVTFFTAPTYGALMRGMLRSSALGREVRMPTGSATGVWASEAFNLRLIAAGNIVTLPETLYWRWHQRAGGLTDAWHALSVEEIIDGHRVNAADSLALIDGLGLDREARELVSFALYLWTMRRVRTAEAEYGASALTPPESVSPAFAGLREPPTLTSLPPELRAWTEAAHDQLLRATRGQARHIGDRVASRAAARRLARRHPRDIKMWIRAMTR